MVAEKQKVKKKNPSSKRKAKKKSLDFSPKNLDRGKLIATLVTVVKDVLNIAIAIKNFLP